ncbi:AIR carboxylase family protein, partial [bacterium]|nr:AIR carboxylase family protein [bacterium]
VKKYVEVVEVIYSGHKSTKASINKLNEIVGNYPDGGVIIAKVGRSNGLGPILAAHTTWPVIAIPATLKSFPNDIWSSVRMPSLVPMATAWPDKNAIRLAVNFLAAKNPALHMWSQKQMESLDP